MITVMLNDGTTEVYLTRVDHTSGANDAALALHKSIMHATVLFGGTALLHEYTTYFTVQWLNGPNQWADAYVVSEGADALGFSSTAENGDTVVFKDTN